MDQAFTRFHKNHVSVVLHVQYFLHSYFTDVCFFMQKLRNATTRSAHIGQ